jgi:hypothetical protein
MLWKASKLSALLVFSLFCAAFTGYSPAGAEVDTAAISKAMQSVAVLTVETEGGQKLQGLAFIALGENRAVTAARLIRNANKVTLRFQDGVEVDALGLVDVDEKRGVALIDIPSSGRGVLNLTQASITPGMVINSGAVKDNTYGFVQLAVAEVHQGASGIERCMLSGEAPSGNSGAPALDSKGNVVGIVIEAQDGRVFVPSAFIAALNASLPTRSWGAQKQTVEATGGVGTVVQTTGSSPMDDIDLMLLSFFTTFYDHYAVYVWIINIIDYYSHFESKEVPQLVYDYQAKLERELKRIAGIRTDDSLRKEILQTALEAGANQFNAVNYLMQAMVIAQQTKAWGAQSDDLRKRAIASFKMAWEVLTPKTSALMQLYKESMIFRKNAPRDLVYMMGLEKRPSVFKIGATTMVTDPFYLLVLNNKSMGEALGLRAGDRIISAAGQKFDKNSSIEDFKVIIQNNLGKTIKVVVQRYGKETTLEMEIPKEIPKEYLYEK